MARSTNAAELRHLAMDTRVDAIGERIARLEGVVEQSQQKSAFEKFGTWGGVIALLVSICTGGFTIYDKIVTEPIQEKAAKLREIRSNIDEIGKIQTTINRSMAENPIQGGAVAAGLTPQMRHLAQITHADFADFPEVFTFSDHMMMGNLLLSFGYAGDATHHADASGQLAENHIETANYLWLKAKIFSAIGDHQNLPEMRKFFAEAITVSKQKDLQISIGTTLQITLEWIAAELNIGECRYARQAVDILKADITLDVVYPQTQEQVDDEFLGIVRNAKNDCGLGANL